MTEPAKDEAELIERISSSIPIWPLLTAIRAAGWAVVPVEPTDEMMWAADRALAPTWEINNPDDLDFVLFDVRRAEWAAMLQTAPGVKP